MHLKLSFILLILSQILSASQSVKDINQKLNECYIEINQSYLYKKKIQNDGVLAVNDKVTPEYLMELPLRSYMESEYFMEIGAIVSNNYDVTNSAIFNSSVPLELQIIYSKAAKTMSRNRYIDYLKFTAANNVKSDSQELLIRSIFSNVSTYENLWSDKNDKRIIDIANSLLENLPETSKSRVFYHSVIFGDVPYTNKHGERTDKNGNSLQAGETKAHPAVAVQITNQSHQKKYNKFTLLVSALLIILALYIISRKITTNMNRRS